MTFWKFTGIGKTGEAGKTTGYKKSGDQNLIAAFHLFKNLNSLNQYKDCNMTPRISLPLRQALHASAHR